MARISVSDEYLESLGEWIIEWALKEESMILPQFYRDRGISHFYVAQFVRDNERFKNAYEVAKAILASKWFEYAMSATNLPSHLSPIIMRYLRIYDSHILGVENEQAMIRKAEPEKQVVNNYYSENYAGQKLTGIYEQAYELNANKRRGRKKA